MKARRILLWLVVVLLPHGAAAEDARAKAVAREPVTMPLASGSVVLPAGTEFEVVESGSERVRLRHRIGEVSVSRAQVEIMATTKTAPAAAAAAEPSPPPADPVLPAPAARPGSVGEGKKPATWEVPRSFDVSIAGYSEPVTRIGDGPRGVVFFSHPDSNWARNMLRTNKDHFRAATGGGTSLFIFEYPEIIVRRLVGKMLTLYLDGDETARIDASGLAARLVEQIREITGIEELLLVGHSMGAGLLLADYEEMSRDERNSFLLISPMELFLPADKTPGAPVRTILLANEESDPFVRSPAWRRWIATHKDRPVIEALEASRDREDPLAVPFSSGHLTVGDQIDGALLARLVRHSLGLSGVEELRVPRRLTSLEVDGRKVMLEMNGTGPSKVVMFDPEAPSQRLHYRPVSTTGRWWTDAPWETSLVAWDFTKPGKQGAFVPGLAPEIARVLRREGAGKIVFYGIGDGASLLMHDYAELAKIPGVTMILLSPRERLMPPGPWPALDPNFAILATKEKFDPEVRSEEFRAWLTANKHPFNEALDQCFAQWGPSRQVAMRRGLHALAERPPPPEMNFDLPGHIRDFHMHKLSDFALGHTTYWDEIPAYLWPFEKK